MAESNLDSETLETSNLIPNCPQFEEKEDDFEEKRELYRGGGTEKFDLGNSSMVREGILDVCSNLGNHQEEITGKDCLKSFLVQSGETLEGSLAQSSSKEDSHPESGLVDQTQIDSFSCFRNPYDSKICKVYGAPNQWKPTFHRRPRVPYFSSMSFSKTLSSEKPFVSASHYRRPGFSILPTSFNGSGIETEPKPEPEPEPEPKPEPSLVGAGLANLGNTCFLNAVLQCFIHTVPLAKGLRSCGHLNAHGDDDEFCVLCAMCDLIERSMASSGGTVRPSYLANNLNYISSFFRRYQQEDAHEFLQCLLDKLDDCWSKYMLKAKDAPSPNGGLVKQVFGGRLVSQLRCCKCGRISDTYEPLINLSLEIDDADDLESALKSFTKVENIEDATCEGCGEQVPAEKQLMLDQGPSVATFHLKRFKSDGISFEKIDKLIKYPLELDLYPYITGSHHADAELKYELYGVVVHAGMTLTSGHYLCYIRPSPDCWFRFDDSEVTRVEEEEALSQEAYLLFYARKGTPWFFTMMETLEPYSERTNSNASPNSVLDNREHIHTVHSNGASHPQFKAQQSRETASDISTGCSNGLREDKPEISEEDEMNRDGSDDEDMVGDNVDDQSTRDDDKTQCDANLKETYKQVMPDNYDDYFSVSPGTSSPDIYSQDSPGARYEIPRAHLKPENEASGSKKSTEKTVHDLKRKEAAKYMRKSMTTGRSKLLMAAMMGPKSNGASNKRKRKLSSSVSKEPSPVGAFG